jgi:DNA-binding NarL/FixJ family response regulator
MILRVADSSEIAAARRAACDLARKIGLDEERSGRAALLVTEMATNLLKHAGGAFEVVEAASAPDGLHHARDHRPDVVLLDLNMAASAAPLPAIVLTSMSISEPNRRRLSTATRIVAKSDITGDVLVGAIRAAVGDRDARPE